MCLTSHAAAVSVCLFLCCRWLNRWILTGWSIQTLPVLLHPTVTSPMITLHLTGPICHTWGKVLNGQILFPPSCFTLTSAGNIWSIIRGWWCVNHCNVIFCAQFNTTYSHHTEVITGPTGRCCTCFNLSSVLWRRLNRSVCLRCIRRVWQVFIMLWGHESVYTLHGLTLLLGTKKKGYI